MGWLNYALGIGTGVNGIVDTTYERRLQFSRTVLDALFRQSGIARKIITRPPFDATREGWTRYPDLDEEMSQALAREERRLRFHRALTQGLIFERLYGGAAVVMDIDDGQEPWKPLARERVRAIRSMRARHRWEIWPHTYIDDPASPDDGEVEVYAVTPDVMTGRTAYVHRSRMLIFDGELTPGLARQENWGWGDSVLDTVWEELRNAGVGDSAVIEYLLQLSIPMVKIKGWWKLLSGRGGETAAQTMLQSLRQRLSMFRVIALDADDGVERLNATVAGLADILTHHKAMVSAVTDMPQTLLYGDSPSGMDATGTSDLELYYGIVRAKVQEDRLREPLEHGLSLIVSAPVWGGGAITNPIPQAERGAEPRVEFLPLWLPSAQEQATTELTRAQARQIYASLGWIDPEQGIAILEDDGMIQPPDPLDELAMEEPEEEVNPLVPPREISAAVAAGILAARRGGLEVPAWEATVARTLASGRPISQSQALQLEQILAEDPATDADDKLRSYFGGAGTLAWLRSIGGAPAAAALPAPAQVPRTDAERIIDWQGYQIRIEVEAGQRREWPGTDRPPTVWPCAYGEILGTVGLDGEPVDVLLYPGWPGLGFTDTAHAGVIVHPASGALDEVKVILGAPDEHAAQALLVLCYGGASVGRMETIAPDLANAILVPGRLDAVTLSELMGQPPRQGEPWYQPGTALPVAGGGARIWLTTGEPGDLGIWVTATPEGSPADAGQIRDFLSRRDSSAADTRRATRPGALLALRRLTQGA